MNLVIPVIENVLSEIIVSRLKVIKANPDIVDRLFSHITTTLRSRLKEYLKSDAVTVIRGFPTERAKLPCYAIMLGGEREQEKFLGDMSDDFSDDVELISVTEQVEVKYKNGKPTIELQHKPLSAVTSILLDGEEVLPTEVVSANRSILAFDEEDVQRGSKLDVEYVYKKSGTEVFGTLFNTQYRIETWTNNGDLTVLLYHLLKYIILSSRLELADKYNLNVQSLGGLDFEPAPEYMPEFVYRRALTFECVIENSYENAFDYIQGIEVDWKLEGDS